MISLWWAKGDPSKQQQHHQQITAHCFSTEQDNRYPSNFTMGLANIMGLYGENSAKPHIPCGPYASLSLSRSSMLLEPQSQSFIFNSRGVSGQTNVLLISSLLLLELGDWGGREGWRGTDERGWGEGKGGRWRGGRECRGGACWGARTSRIRIVCLLRLTVVSILEFYFSLSWNNILDQSHVTASIRNSGGRTFETVKTKAFSKIRLFLTA